MLFAKVASEGAEALRRRLLAEGVFDPSHDVQRTAKFIFFPVKRALSGLTIVERPSLARLVKPRTLQEALAGKMPQADLDKLVTSFDTIGDLAVIEVRHGLDEKLIGEAVLVTNPAIKVVCKKAGGHAGPYRVMPVEVIAGEPRTIAVYREHGVLMKVDVDKVYFSPRLSEERRRIAELVKPGEVIAALFAGVGPFPLVIAKKKQCTIYAVELNPVGIELMKENIAMNKLKGTVAPMLGDVRVVAPTLPKCDRVLMLAPKTGEEFLKECIQVAKPGGIVHYYEFAPEADLFTVALARVEKAAAALGRKVTILNKQAVRPHAVRTMQVAVDFRVD